MSSSPRIVIIGAGPTGLGAAWRLKELKYTNWHIYEKHHNAGGLSTSYVDDQGFTWDFGGHVQFSHYPYFDKLMDKLLHDDWNHLVRESWVWLRDRFIPYPFQYNIRYLDAEDTLACLTGLLALKDNTPKTKPRNFEEWIEQGFGRGLADIFMLPYNFKVWAYPPKMMQYQWIGERVATVDLKRLLENVLLQKEDISWGPNNTFRFPKRGGTGAIWTTLANILPQKNISYRKEVVRIDAKKKKIYFDDKTSDTYDILLSTMPQNILIRKTNIPDLKKYAAQFKFSSTHVVGLGLKGRPKKDLHTKCWMYFPENNCPFYRTTVFSNYSRYHVPRPGQQWSLMTETAESPYKKVDKKRIIQQTIHGALNTKLISSQKNIVSTAYYYEHYGYPTPFLHRDAILAKTLPTFKRHDIYTRGRFGLWKYEVSNQDHSLMQGVEAINHMLKKEKEITAFHPDIVNKL